ncbi:MAG: sulfite exporter TauE/SafE family protein [Tepidiformaceae bacterium]
MDPWTIASVCALAAVAAFTQSLSGFGFSLLIVPPLTLILGPRDAVVTANALGMLVNAATLQRLHEQVDWRLGGRLFAAAALGMPAGLLVLVFVPRDALQVLIAVTVLVSTVLIWRGWRIEASGRGADIGVGLVSGVLNTSTSMSGPPVVLYLQGKGFLRGMFRATLTAYFLAIGALALVLFVVSGQFDREVAAITLFAAPALLLGFVIGHTLFHRLDEERFRQVVIGVLILSAALAMVGPLVRAFR